MAPKNPTTPSDAVHALTNRLKDAKTEKELFKITLDTEFRSAVYALSDADKQHVKNIYDELNKFLGGRVTLDDIDGEPVTITDIREDYSTRYDNDFVVITGTRENGSKFTALSSAVRIVRFCQKVNSEGRLPVTVTFNKKPHEDGKTMWHVSERRNREISVTFPWES